MTHAPNHLAKCLTALTLGLECVPGRAPGLPGGPVVCPGAMASFLRRRRVGCWSRRSRPSAGIPWDEPLARAGRGGGRLMANSGRRATSSGAFFRLDSGSVASSRAGPARRPTSCSTASPKHRRCVRGVVEATPLSTFDVFWTTFREHYPFFEMKGVDWDSVRGRLRPQISDGTEPEELFKLLSEAVAPLEDMHTSNLCRGPGPRHVHEAGSGARRHDFGDGTPSRSSSRDSPGRSRSSSPPTWVAS